MTRKKGKTEQIKSKDGDKLKDFPERILELTEKVDQIGNVAEILKIAMDTNYVCLDEHDIQLVTLLGKIIDVITGRCVDVSNRLYEISNEMAMDK